MPLKPCHQKSKKAKASCTSDNIREMRKGGHKQKQAVAAAMRMQNPIDKYRSNR